LLHTVFVIFIKKNEIKHFNNVLEKAVVLMKKENFTVDAITSEEELRDIIGNPHESAQKKIIPMIDATAKRFISASSLLFLSTSDASGKCTVSPRGDVPGFIHVLNDTQLVIPDRPGNRKLDSLVNILSNPQVGLIFLIPGLDEVLRVNGRASIIRNKVILSQMKLKGEEPLLGIGVDVEECFIHCPRAMKESKVWNPDVWPDKENLPSMMDILRAHLKVNGMEIKES
jgi:PPOX class probable FMN-dependent enzyme